MTDIGYGPTLVFRDPDNIQLEFYVHPGAGEVAQCFTEAESPDAKRLIEATANPQTQSADKNFYGRLCSSSATERGQATPHFFDVNVATCRNSIPSPSAIQLLHLRCTRDVKEGACDQLWIVEQWDVRYVGQDGERGAGQGRTGPSAA
jgi:hypothetical protein